jgi:type VI secretion system protein ImpK
MTLLELCEPLFQYACRINQRATLGDHPDPVQVEADVEGILTSMRNKASKTAGLIEQYERVELPLIFFIDNIIFESQLSFSKDWPRLAYKRNEMAGDEKFFVLLDEELRERSTTPSLAERLAVYYTCLGLGFTGWHAGEPDVLRRYMRQLEPRVRAMVDTERKRVTPEAYEHTLRDDLTEPPARPLTKIVIALVGLVIALFVGNAYLYRAQTNQLNTALEKISQTGGPGAVASASSNGGGGQGGQR